MLLDFYQDFTMKLVPIFLRQQLRGLQVDLSKRQALRDEFQIRIDEAAQRLAVVAGRPVLAKKGFSPPVLSDLLYNKLRLPKQFHPKTKKLTANREALEKLEGKVNDAQRPIFQDIYTVRDLGVLVNTFLDARLDADGHYRWSSNLAGTVTGRISTSASPFWTGNNVQNISEDIRDIFVAPPGWIFVYADGEQAEARVVAFLAEDRGLINVFESGVNVHAKMSSVLFKTQVPVTADEFEEFKHSDHYRLAKATVHACVDDQTEVLTSTGWLSIKDVTTQHSVAQWDPKTEAISFVCPSATHSYSYKGPMLHWESNSCSQLVTPEHKIPYYSNGSFKWNTAEELAKQRSIRLPVSGYFSGSATEDLKVVQLAVAIQADGSNPYGAYTRFHLKKARKIKRLEDLLQKLNIGFTKSAYADGSFGINFTDSRPYRWLREKKFGPQLLELPNYCLMAFLEELKYWDGSLDEGSLHKREQYNSKDIQNIEWVQIIAHLQGRQSLLNSGTRTLIASLSNRSKARAKEPREVSFEGRVYCLTVPSGFFMIRRDQKVSITGNSNYGMGKRKAALLMRKREMEAQAILNLYHSNFPGVRSVFQERTKSQLYKSRLLTTPFGRRRQFFGRFGDDLLREGYSYVPQGTVGDWLNVGILRFDNFKRGAFAFGGPSMKRFYELPKLRWASSYEELKMPEAESCANQHDGHLAMVPIEHLERGIVLMREAHTFEIPFGIGRLTIPVDVKIGDRWGQLEKATPEAIERFKRTA